MGFPVRWSNHAFEKDGCAASDSCAVHNRPGICCGFPKRGLRVETFHIRDGDDPSCSLHGGKIQSKNVTGLNRVEQVRTSKNLDQVGDLVFGNAWTAITEHLRKGIHGIPQNLGARSGPFRFKEFIARFDPMRVVFGPAHSFGPVIIFAGECVQI